MRRKEFITERNYSGPLYHMTDPSNVLSILRQGFYFVDATTYNDEQQFIIKKNYHYYLSTSRSLNNRFRERSYSMNSLAASMKLDSSFINQKDFIVAPLNYFQNKVIKSLQNIPKTSWEAEERIWSRKQVNNLFDAVMEVHILYNKLSYAEIHDINTSLELYGKPVFWYEHAYDYMRHNKKESKPFDDIY